MKKIQCDRCGKYFSEKDDNKCTINVMKKEVGGSFYKDIDLCEHCAKDFDIWYDFEHIKYLNKLNTKKLPDLILTGDNEYGEWSCPNCGHVYSTNKFYKYCPECGQQIDLNL